MLNIIGNCLSPDEKKTIEKIVRDDFSYDLGLAGRLASIKVVFSETYEDPDYTESEVEKLYSEIEQDVNETIQEDNLYQKEETL